MYNTVRGVLQVVLRRQPEMNTAGRVKNPVRTANEADAEVI